MSTANICVPETPLAGSPSAKLSVSSTAGLRAPAQIPFQEGWQGMSRGEFLKSTQQQESAILFPPADTSQFGLTGPSSIAPSTEADPALRSRIDGLLESVREIRPVLRANQARTEEEAAYSPEVHEFFVERGIYRALKPRMFGGEEIGIPGYFRLIAEIARGGPSTAWCVSLGAGHNLQIGSYWPEQAQREIFANDYFLGRPAAVRGGPERAGEVLRGEGIELRYRSVAVGHDIDFEVRPGECVAVVGESGSGKTTLSRALIGLHPNYSGRISWGDETLKPKARRRSKRNVRELQYIFQSPFNSLNPKSTIGQSLDFAYSTVRSGPASARRAAAEAALELVGLRHSVLEQMPNELSGGERQRVAIARAPVVDPKLLICDEITSALDVIVQKQVVQVLLRLQSEKDLSMLFVTHNLALVKQIADRVIVMESGRIVESGPTERIMNDPEHPCTRELLENTLSISTALAAR